MNIEKPELEQLYPPREFTFFLSPDGMEQAFGNLGMSLTFENDLVKIEDKHGNSKSYILTESQPLVFHLEAFFIQHKLHDYVKELEEKLGIEMPNANDYHNYKRPRSLNDFKFIEENKLSIKFDKNSGFVFSDQKDSEIENFRKTGGFKTGYLSDIVYFAKDYKNRQEINKMIENPIKRLDEKIFDEIDEIIKEKLNRKNATLKV